MDDSPKPAEAVAHTLQGPHRADLAEAPATGEFPPLRLTMQPKGPSVVLRGPDQVLGRHSDCDLRLPLPDVSRKHCRFLYKDGHWDVIDLNSLNGVFVNGERVLRARLNNRDQIRVGGVTLEVTLPAVPAVIAAKDAQVLRSIADALPQPADAAQPEKRRAS